MASVLSAGTTSNTALNLSADTTGILQFQTNGTTAAMTLDTSQNVGIGTSSPSVGKLVVKLSSTGSTNGLAIVSSANDTFLSIYNNGSVHNIEATYSSTGSFQPIAFVLSSAERMRIGTDGNVGIGTASPSFPLDISAASGTTARIKSTGNYSYVRLDNGTATGGGAVMCWQNGVQKAVFGVTGAILGDTSGDAGIYAETGQGIRFYGNATERMRIGSDGNVGIGTSSPSSKLHVVGDVFVGGNNNLQWSSYSAGTSGVLWTGHGTNNTLDAYTTGTLRMRIDSSGNVLVGKTSFSDSVVGIQLPNSGLPTFTASSSTSGASTLNIYSTGASAYRFYVNMAGTVFATNTTISGISDQRLKENIVDLDDGLNAVMALKPRKFDWKEGKGKNIKGDRGFIAQEFETVFPDMIEEWKDPAPEGEDPYKAVNPNLIPTLVKAIQELKAELDATKAEIAALKGVN